MQIIADPNAESREFEEEEEEQEEEAPPGDASTTQGTSDQEITSPLLPN